MRFVILLILFFSNLVYGKENLHNDTLYYTDTLIEILPKINNINEIDLYNLSNVIEGLSQHGLEEKAFKIYKEIEDSYAKQNLSDEFFSNSYIQDSYITYLFYKNGFESAYEYSLGLENFSKESAIGHLFYLSKLNKNEVRMLFLLKEHENVFSSDARYSSSDLLSYNAEVLKLLIEKNSLSSQIILDDLINSFFNLKIDEIRPNHEWLMDVCFSSKNIDCLKRYLEKGEEFKSGMNEGEFEYNIGDILIFFIKQGELDLMEGYFRKYFLSNKIKEETFQEIYKWYPVIVNEVSELMQIDVNQIELGIIIDNLIRDYKELSNEEKQGALKEINKIVFNKAHKFVPGETEGDRIDNLYLSLANYALRYKEKELAKILGKTWIMNVKLSGKAFNEEEMKNVILFLINAGVFSDANDLIVNSSIQNGDKNYLLSRLAEASVIDGDNDFTLDVINNWNVVKNHEPIIEKTFFKHKDDIVVYDSKLAVDLLIYSSKSYLNDKFKKEVSNFVEDFVNRDTPSSVFSWQISEVEDFLDHLLENSMLSESVKLANWYVEKYLPPENKKTISDTEEFKYDFLEKIFKYLIKKEDLTSAFFILEKIEPSKESFLLQGTIEKKKNKLLVNASSLIEEKKLFIDYLEFFSAEEKINIISKRINKKNKYWVN